MKTGRKSARAAALTILLTLISSMALAAPNLSLALIDTFDYTDGNLKHAHLNLDYLAGTLVLSFGSRPAANALPPIKVDEGPVYAAGAVPKRRGLASVFEAVTLDYRGHTLHSARFAHEANSIADVIGAYRAELESRGFRASFESGTGNIQVYRFHGAEGTLRIVFSRTAEGARAFIVAR